MGCNVSYSDSRSQSGNRSQSKRKVKMDISLPNGDKMPAVGYGTWKAAGDDLEIGLEAALEAGYRHIDTAAAYQNEEIIGKVLKRWFDEGKLKRKDLFITTKLPPYGLHTSEVEKYLNKSLADLQLDYVDLYLIHTPFGLAKGEDLFSTDENGYIIFDPDTDHIALWKEMEAQVDAGKTRSIGISNFNVRQMKKLLVNARIPPANLQVELHVFLQQQELTNFCKENDITVTAYSPLGSGAWKNTAENGHPESINTCPEVKELADRHNKSQAQVLLRFLVQEGYSVIPKSVNPKRIQENIDIFDFELDEDEMDRLKSLDQGENGRVITFDFFKGIRDHPEFPF